jgi:hypothetical protein
MLTEPPVTARTHDRLEQRRFAAAVDADQRGDRSRRYPERGVHQRRMAVPIRHRCIADIEPAARRAGIQAHRQDPPHPLGRDAEEVEIGWNRAAFLAQRVDVKDAAVTAPRFARDLLRRIGRNGAFAEHDGDPVLTDLIDDSADLLRRALLVGVDRPKVKLAQTKVAREIAERTFARHQPAPRLGNERASRFPDRIGGGPDALLVRLRIARYVFALPGSCLAMAAAILST